MAKGRSTLFFQKRAAAMTARNCVGKVLYVDVRGCLYMSLPFFVDGAGRCHASLVASKEDLYVDCQLEEMREAEERKRQMAIVLEELVATVRTRQRRAIQSNLAKSMAARSPASDVGRMTPAEREGLMRDVFGSHGTDPITSKRRIGVEHMNNQATNSRCAYSPRSRKSKPRHLQQPKAVY